MNGRGRMEHGGGNGGGYFAILTVAERSARLVGRG
jgi:hypothetical protein